MSDYEILTPLIGTKPNTVLRTATNTFMPLYGDCTSFLVDWKAGATVTNADGSPAPYSDAAVIALGLMPSE